MPGIIPNITTDTPRDSEYYRYQKRLSRTLSVLSLGAAVTLPFFTKITSHFFNSGIKKDLTHTALIQQGVDQVTPQLDNAITNAGPHKTGKLRQSINDISLDFDKAANETQTKLVASNNNTQFGVNLLAILSLVMSGATAFNAREDARQELKLRQQEQSPSP